MTHLGKMPHMEQLGVGTWSERLSSFYTCNFTNSTNAELDSAERDMSEVRFA